MPTPSIIDAISALERKEKKALEFIFNIKLCLFITASYALAAITDTLKVRWLTEIIVIPKHVNSTVI
jgi:isoprenylcysteine carboxyl methyltransferase (ICMT) family protein YpbQ